MNLDPEIKIIKLCGTGMLADGAGQKQQAGECFAQAWKGARINFDKAISNYELAAYQGSNLPQDGYGKMIVAGIQNGLARVSRQEKFSQAQSNERS